jgi:trimethylamine--corrinoid protein Co-methyltransferase
VILGSLPAFFDMKGMGSFYDPQSYAVNLACVEMMAYYQLPHCGTSGSGTGWGADLIAGGHQWSNHLTSCLGKVGLVPFEGQLPHFLGHVQSTPAELLHKRPAWHLAAVGDDADPGGAGLGVKTVS